MSVCLLPDKIDEFKQALKEKDIKIVDLLNMSTEDRTAILEKYAGENAKAVNTAFEEKLVLKNRIQGIKNWAAKIGEVGKYSELGKAELEKALSDYKSKQQERIFSPKENEAFLNDLADKKLGVHISRDVAAKVFELSKKAQDLKEKSPTMAGVSNEYLQAKNELNNYIESQKPLSVKASVAKNLAVIGRNNLLLNLSTPIKAIAGNLLNSTMDFVTRRLANISATGESGDLVSKANKEAWNTFRQTGMNTAAMESLDDTHMLGKGENFKVANSADAKGAAGMLEKGIRNVAKVSNKVAIDYEHNYAFTKFYQKAFYDAANIISTNLAKSEGLKGTELTTRARDLFTDAARIEPQTAEGAMLRNEVQQQVARITSTNDTLVSRFSLGIKNALNKIVPNFPIGDILMPIAKIPASIIANGIDNAGAGLPKGISDIFKGREKIQSSDLSIRYEGMVQFANGIQRLGRIGGTLGVAALLTSRLTAKDFKTDIYGTHYVKIGNTWINTEYFSAVSPALAGMMSVKEKNTKGSVNDVSQYVAGTLRSLQTVPGIDEGSKLVTAITNANYAKGIKKYATDFFTSRGEPAFLQNLSKDRPINRLFFGAHGVESTQQVSADAKAAALAKKKK